MCREMMIFFFLLRENLKLPQLAAIQHNNCMYLAHHLLTLGHHFRAHLPQALGEGLATFVDMVPGFRKLGRPTSSSIVKLNVVCSHEKQEST